MSKCAHIAWTHKDDLRLFFFHQFIVKLISILIVCNQQLLKFALSGQSNTSYNSTLKFIKECIQYFFQ